MTALTITPADVVLASGNNVHKDQVAGEAFDAGDYVYRNASGAWLKAENGGTAIEAGSLEAGMALATADAVGARVSVAGDGCIVTIGTGTAGVVYIVDGTAGLIAPVADGGSGDKITVVGVGIGSNQIKLRRIYHAGSELA